MVLVTKSVNILCPSSYLRDDNTLISCSDKVQNCVKEDD